MTPNQSLATNKGAHIIPTSNVKSSSVAITATSSPRATTIVSTAPRKREVGKCAQGNHITFQRKFLKKNLHSIFKEFRTEVVQLQSTQRPTSPISRPGSSDGSTTVSATSSPGIDQQEHEELNAILYQVRIDYNRTYASIEYK